MTNTNKARLASAIKAAKAFGATVAPLASETRYNTFANLSRGGTTFVQSGDSGECFALVLGSGRVAAVVIEGSDGWNARKPAEDRAHPAKEFALRAHIFADAPSLAACVKLALETY